MVYGHTGPPAQPAPAGQSGWSNPAGGPVWPWYEKNQTGTPKSMLQVPTTHEAQASEAPPKSNLGTNLQKSQTHPHFFQKNRRKKRQKKNSIMLRSSPLSSILLDRCSLSVYLQNFGVARSASVVRNHPLFFVCFFSNMISSILISYTILGQSVLQGRPCSCQGRLIHPCLWRSRAIAAFDGSRM